VKKNLTNNNIDQLVALGHRLIEEATGLRVGAVNSGTTRKGLSEDQKKKLISKRFKTALKKTI